MKIYVEKLQYKYKNKTKLANFLRVEGETDDL